MHDTIEDTEVTFEDLEAQFGTIVANLVLQLTNVSKLTDGNRSVRKEIDRNHIARASIDAKTIKLADLIDNSESILKFDKAFAKVFLREMSSLLEVLKDGDEALYELALNVTKNNNL